MRANKLVKFILVKFKLDKLLLGKFRLAELQAVLCGKEKEFFIATPEKALLDSFYLMSYGRYALDLSALDADKLDRENIRRLSSKFPLKTRHMLKRYRYLQAT